MIRNHGFDPAFSFFSFKQIYDSQRRPQKGTHALLGGLRASGVGRDAAPRWSPVGKLIRWAGTLLISRVEEMLCFGIKLHIIVEYI